MRIPTIVKIAIGFLSLMALLAIFAFGIVVQRYKVFPYALIAKIENAFEVSVDRATGADAWYYREIPDGVPAPKTSPNFNTNQLFLISLIGPDRNLYIRMLDTAGNIKNEWRIDWFELWPDATHLPENIVPKMRPGTTIHGIGLMNNGDVVFNLENLGLFRMTPCGTVVWKLPYQTHHSIQIDEQQNLWVSGLITRTEASADYPGYVPEYLEPTVLKVSRDGEILREISLFEVLSKNDMEGYLHMSRKGFGAKTSGDTLHLNDVEILSKDKNEGIFKHGDIMVSLRNISTVFVFDPETLKIKFATTGAFARQHDPDFIDGNTFSVFDNNDIAQSKFGIQSRIKIFSVPNDSAEIWYTGSAENPLFTAVMGAHEWISSDVALLTESSKGRVIVVNKSGEILWEYYNATGPTTVGIVPDAMPVPADLHSLFARPQSERCAETSET